MSPKGILNMQRLKEQLLRNGMHPEMVALQETMYEILGYDIPQERAASFQRFESRQLSSLAPWRGHHLTTKRKWFFGCSTGISMHVRGALAAAHYHADRLREIQERANIALAEPCVKRTLGNGVIGLGYPRALDIEYQAFILAIRRCLDYLACALACFFLREADSFRTFPKSIARTRFPEVAAALTEAHARHLSQLDFVLAAGRRSVRHRVAHYEFVSVGSVNIRSDGFFLLGGPENIRLGISCPTSWKATSLNNALADRLDSLHACVDDMIDTFLQGVGTDQPRGIDEPQTEAEPDTPPPPKPEK
jgi:hypothetical protein